MRRDAGHAFGELSRWHHAGTVMIGEKCADLVKAARARA
jgi:hypothetical protein